MDIHGYLWISMDPWIFVDILGYPWTFMDIHGYPRISMDIHGYPPGYLNVPSIGFYVVKPKILERVFLCLSAWVRKQQNLHTIVSHGRKHVRITQMCEKQHIMLKIVSHGTKHIRTTQIKR